MRTPVRRFAGTVISLDSGSGEATAQFPGVGERSIVSLPLPNMRHGNLKGEREELPLFYTWGEMACERKDPPPVTVGMHVLADITEFPRGEWMVVRWKTLSDQEYENYFEGLED